MLRAALTSWVASVGLEMDDDAWVRLDALVGLWQRYGPALNLLGAYDAQSLVEHVREGLAARRVAELAVGEHGDATWLDIGSGGGLPGLVVAATTRWSVHLVEPRAKRAAFLELASATIARGKSRVSRARFGDATWDQSGVLREISGSDPQNVVASARAVFSPEDWLRAAREALPPRAIIIVHVAAATRDVAGEPPAWRVEADRWAALGYRAAAPAA